MRKLFVGLVAPVVAALVFAPAMSASAAGGAIENGSFEANPVGTSITGWTAMNQLIDLGVTQIAGCTTQDTSDYTQLTEWDENWEYELSEVPTTSSGVVLDADSTEIWFDATGAVVPPGTLDAYPLYYGFVASDYDGDSYTDFYFIDEGITYPYDYSDPFTGDDDLGDAADDFVDDTFYVVEPDPEARADNVPAADSSYWDQEEPPVFTSSIVNASRDLARDSNGDVLYDADDEEIINSTPLSSQALELSSDLHADDASGYVAHGPAVYSDVFTTDGPRAIQLDWMASSIIDDYHVLGYLLNVDTCEQIEVLDDEGESAAWTTESVVAPAAGNYRFVFVAGSYDRTWGSAAGAVLYIDNIRATPVFATPGIDLEPLFAVGDPVADAPIQLSGGGLLANSAWTAVLHSDPVTLATGFADADGNFWLLSQLPADVEPGQHEIILTGTAPDGSALTDRAYITVSAAGIITYVSLIGAEGTAQAANMLPDTGAPTVPLMALGGGLLLAGIAALVVFQVRRRKASV